MKKIILSSIAAAGLLFTTSCKTDFDTDVTDIQVTSGTADFSRFVAVGNSLTSGYRDGALYIDGQNESFPSMLAKQFALAGGGAFKQPLMADNLGGIPSLGVGNKLVLGVSSTGSLSPVVATGTGTTTVANIFAQGPYQNMGVPGAKSFHLVAPGYGNPANLLSGLANPYFVRFASSPNATVLQDAMAQNPTFFSLWIGNNDVLGYALSGGDGTNPITTTATFNGAYDAIINGLTANGAKGVVMNIPNVATIPYFTTVPSKPIAGLSDAQVTQLNGAYATYNAGLAQAKAGNAITEAEYQQRLIKFTAGIANGAVIKDKDLTNLGALPSYRMTTAKDLILLPASTLLQQGAGTATQLDDKYVLTEKETMNVLTATTTFNASIKTKATAKGLALFDANAKMAELSSASGISYDGVKYTAKFVTGGTFSLDGVHLTGRGYAVIANEILKVINKQYGSTLPLVDGNKYSGVAFP